MPGAVDVTRTPPDAAGNIDLNIKITGAPHAHTKAIDPYRLAIWSQWPGQAFVPITITDPLASDNGMWSDLDKGNGEITVSVHHAQYK